MVSNAMPKRATVQVRMRFFTDRFDWMGPAIVVLSSWYFAAQVLVAWVVRPPYNVVSDAISDLGSTACSQSPSGFCSPLHVWMNVSIGILGFAMIVGSVLIFSEFSFSKDQRERAAAIAGFGCMALGGVGAILVGVFPENMNTAHLHTVGTVMAIGLGQLAILVLGLALRQIDDWLREFMLVTSLIVLLASISMAGNHHFGIGGGALERLAQYPECLWLILFGLYISRDRYRSEVVEKGFKFSADRPEGNTFWWALGASLRSLKPGAGAPPPQRYAAGPEPAPEPPAADPEPEDPAREPV
jgi:hypothetical membrane protein